MKKTSKKNKCTNPLFEKWLEEWRDEAAARDSTLQHSFGKALNSLKKFPLSLATGKDCNVLEYFGPKICSMLDKKLDQYRRDHNLPADTPQIVCYQDEIKAKRKKTAQLPDNHLPSTSDAKEGEKFDQEQLEDNAKKKKTRKTVNKPYVPKVGSGGYALLVTLYKNTKEGSNKPDFMLKKDLISESKFYCDAPMKSTATEHYSGWSSMSTLIEKNLVTKKSVPAKYRLTDAGFALALQLVESLSAQDENDENFCNESSSSASKSDNRYQSVSSQSSCETNSVPNNLYSSSPKAKNIDDFYNEIKSPDVYSNHNSNNSPTFSEKYNDILKSPINKPTISNSSCESKNLTNGFPISSQKDGDVIVIDSEDEDDDVFKNPQIKYDDINIQSNENFENLEIDQEFKVFCKENAEPLTPIKRKPSNLYCILDLPNNLLNQQKIDAFSEQQFGEVDFPVDSTTSNKKKQCLSPHLSTSKSETHKRNINFDNPEINDIINSNENPVCSTTEQKVTLPEKMKRTTTSSKSSKNKKTASAETPTEMFYLLPNNFDIILLVDTQETSGGKTRPKDDATISELSALQTVFEIRSLKVGDFAWIARCRFTNKELVLPFIVERKRIDDLAGSIKDGRYHEQKFRLRQSGIKNVIYLIENYGTTYHGCMPITSLFQAAVNSLVQDNFQVKFTKDHKDSMSYLATITKMLMEIYESKELISCRKKDIELANADDPNSIPLMEFSEFNKGAMKTKNFKVKEMLIRQLLQLKGLSVDKAIAITEFYPTPKLLREALKNSDEKLLANIEAGSSKMKIGPALSKTIWQFYTQRNFA